jgi:hypothetical protein
MIPAAIANTREPQRLSPKGRKVEKKEDKPVTAKCDFSVKRINSYDPIKPGKQGTVLIPVPSHRPAGEISANTVVPL